jgi:hypothetical protein
VEEGVRRMSLEWVAVYISVGSLVVGLATLVVAWRVLRSARRSQQGGDERLEILREQQERLRIMHQERSVAHQELERLRGALDEQERQRTQYRNDTLNAAISDLINTLQSQLEAERQAHAEARRSLAASLERKPSELQAPRYELAELIEDDRRAAEARNRGGQPRPATRSAKGATERRWWEFWR